MAPTRLVVATRNVHKLRELSQILPGFGLEPLPDDVELPPETGETFAANALAKARAANAVTGLPSIADDSGIAAYGLGGRPGVRSARYAGEGASDEENLELLIEEVGAQEDRRVVYVCALAFVDGDEEELFEGRCEGELIDEPRGAGGFGYDPAVVPLDTGCGDVRTMAELSDDEKHAISHRGRAARELAAHLGLDAPAPAEGAG
jgi:XTP/dITP diphosphohydrolase